MQRQRSAIRHESQRNDTFEPYRWVLGDVASCSIMTSAPPQRTRFAALILLLPAVFLLAAAVISSAAPGSCKSSPLLLRLDQNVSTTMQLGSGTRCAVRVHPGATSVEELLVDLHPRHGTLSPRGRTGLVYQPDARFKGEDSFSFSLRGKTDQKKGTMTVGVDVVVE